MATVRLHTQHHSAGGLRPATPTCCCCSCCCVGSTLGTFTVLPIMIARSAAQQPPEEVVETWEFAGEKMETRHTPATPWLDRRMGPWGEGALAFVVAALPVLLIWLFPDPIVILCAPFAAFVGLVVWATVRARSVGRPVWPPLTVALVLFPIGFFVELLIGVPMVTSGNAAYGWVALAIGAAILGLGIYASTARRA